MFSSSQAVQKPKNKTDQVLKYSNSIRETGLHTDVCVETGKKSFRAHRLILSCYSMYFRTIFPTETHEKYADTVEIKDVDEISMKSIIDFIYSGKISINHKNVFDLLAASDYLQIDQIKQFCFEYLFGIVSIETCFTILKTADLYEYNNLINKTFQYIQSNFGQFSSSHNFVIQVKQFFFDLLSKLNSDHTDESSVYDIIIKNLKRNKDRENNFVALFHSLELSKFSISFLADTASSKANVIENCLRSNTVIITMALKFLKRLCNFSSKILSIGGYSFFNKVFVVHKNDQTVYPSLPQGIYAHCSLKLLDYVYCIGGRATDSPLRRVWRMQIHEASMKWEEVALMKVCRAKFAAAVYKNGIAVAGGRLHIVEQSAEFYDPSLNQWSSLPSMNKGRSGNALVACNDHLFCLGGYHDTDRYLSSVEMLGDLKGPWKYVQPMQTSRTEFAAVNCMGYIYAIGGFIDQRVPIKSVEKYDPATDQWIYVKEMNTERLAHSACVMQDKIFVVGGKNAKNAHAYEIECYDPLIDDWSIVGNTNEKLLYHSIVAI